MSILRWRQLSMSMRHRFLDVLISRFGLALIQHARAWELIEAKYLSQFLRTFSVDCVFDVGANRGEYAIRLRRMGFKGLILSFEPNPDAVPILKAVAKSDSRWEVIPLALDSNSRSVPFNVMRRQAFSSLHEPDHSNTTKFSQLNVIDYTIQIETATLHDLFPSLQSDFGFSRPFLKVDTQANDLAVVRGAGNLIDRFVGLQSELSFVRLYRDCPLARETLECYERLGFCLAALVPNTDGHFPNLYEMDCIMHNPFFKRGKDYRPASRQIART
jgi:FkbM family methyltransferase